MQRELEIRVEPDALDDWQAHRDQLARELKVDIHRIRHIELRRRGIDARRKQPRFVLRYAVWIDQEYQPRAVERFVQRDVSQAEPVLVVGSGPAGLFAALRLIELGFRPVVLERGQDVRARRHDIAAVSKKGMVPPESNYCFGEGGAGTFSDGKLYTRATKRGNVERVLQILVDHGASSEILIEAHPHIGTNKLPKVVSSITSSIIACGGSVFFGERVVDIQLKAGAIVKAGSSTGAEFDVRAIVLATGHSARDVYSLLADRGLSLEAKPFALGVRVEHPQSLIDRLQYGTSTRHRNLPAASYALRAQVDGRAVFSFCMCPGGVICPAATDAEEVVVNGWSPSKRNSRFANSGIVVEVRLEDVSAHFSGTLAGIEFQRLHEHAAYRAGGGALVAPAQRLTDFVRGTHSTSLVDCSYNPGLKSVELSEVLQPGIYRRLQGAFREFERQRPGYLTEEALVVATESRTSSPVRIPRESQSLMHPQAQGLFPSGEGAGYAGGIMSAAIDGQRVAEAVANFLRT